MVKLYFLRGRIFTTALVVGAIFFLALVAVLLRLQTQSEPRMSALDVVSKTNEYCQRMGYAGYSITAIEYCRPAQLGYASYQGGTWQVIQDQEEASWFIKMTNYNKGDIIIFRLMNDGTWSALTDFQT